MRRYPLRRASGVSLTSSFIESREWYRIARGSSWMMGGGSLPTLITASVTSRVPALDKIRLHKIRLAKDRLGLG